MAIQIINTLAFTGVAPGATATLAHGLNFGGVGRVPDTVDVPDGFEFVSADATDLTVRNTGSGVASTTVLVEAWHTLLRAFGPASVKALTPQPYVRNTGSPTTGSPTTFVYQPGGTAGGNVYTTEASLYAALAAVRGPKVVEFRDNFVSPIVLASGADMADTTWQGATANGNSFGPSAVVHIADGVAFPNLLSFGPNINVLNLNTVTPAVTLTNFDHVFVVGNSDLSTVAGGAPFFGGGALPGGGLAPFFLEQVATLGFIDSGPVIDFPVAGTTLFLLVGDGCVVSDIITGAAGVARTDRIVGSGGSINDQTGWAGSITEAMDAQARHLLNPSPPAAPATAPVTAAFNQTILLDASGGAIAQILPSISTAGAFRGTGTTVTVKETSGSVGVTVDGAGADTIDGAGAPVAVPAGGARTFESDGVGNWNIVSGYL